VAEFLTCICLSFDVGGGFGVKTQLGLLFSNKKVLIAQLIGRAPPFYFFCYFFLDQNFYFFFKKIQKKNKIKNSKKMDISTQQIIDFHIKENEKDDGYFMDVEIHDDFDYITAIQQQNWKENETMVNSFIKYCLAKQYQISKWKTQEHKFERQPNWIEFQGITLCPVTWLLDTGLKTVGWIDVKTDNVYSNQMLEYAIVKKTLVKIAKPSVLGCRSYINFKIDKQRQLSTVYQVRKIFN